MVRGASEQIESTGQVGQRVPERSVIVTFSMILCLLQFKHLSVATL